MSVVDGVGRSVDTRQLAVTEQMEEKQSKGSPMGGEFMASGGTNVALQLVPGLQCVKVCFHKTGMLIMRPITRTKQGSHAQIFPTAQIGFITRYTDGPSKGYRTRSMNQALDAPADLLKSSQLKQSTVPRY